MTIFSTTLNQMMFMAAFLVAGYVLRRKNALPENAATVMSKLENDIILPCMVLNSFISRCTVETLSTKGNLLLWGALTIGVGVVIATPLSKAFSREHDLRGIYMYSLAVSNMGYMGNAIAQAVFGDDVFFDYLIFCIPFTIVIYSWGVSVMTPIQEGKKKKGVNGILKAVRKQLLSPVSLAMIIGLVLGLTGIPVPSFLMKAFASGGNCMAPIAMLLTGFVIGGYPIKSLLTNKKIYIASFLRLILLPLLIMLLVKGLGADSSIQTLVLTSVCMPLGLYTVIYPASYGGDTSTGAGMALISHVLSLITIPVMYMILL